MTIESHESHESTDEPSAGQQRRQANILLLRLQWLLIALLMVALAWLYIAQQRFQNQVNERLQSNEQVVTRLNEMDDRVFAISQQNLPKSGVITDSQAQNQLDLLRVQIQATDRLLSDNNYQAAIDLLRGLQWQLSQPTNEIAPALTIVIKQSISADIERLQAQSTQPSPWQLQNLAIRNVQEFLYSPERINSLERNNSPERSTVTNSNTINNDANRSHAKASNSLTLTRRQLTIHEAMMTLNLAMQASNMHDKEQLIAYLTQARKQLNTVVTNHSATQKNTTISDKAAPLNSKDKQVDTNSTGNLEAIEAPSNIAETITALDKLIANAPKPVPLLTTQVLEQPKA